MLSLLLVFLGTILKIRAQSGDLSFHGGDYIVHWSLDQDQKNITFDIRVEGAGWVGLGVSVAGNMKDADIAIAEIVNGAPVLKDYYSRRAGFPILDEMSNIHVLNSGQMERTTSIKFTRALDTGDLDQDVKIPLTGIYVIWAYSETTRHMLYHEREFRGQEHVIFDPTATDPTSTTTEPTTTEETTTEEATTEETTTEGDASGIVATSALTLFLAGVSVLQHRI